MYNQLQNAYGGHFNNIENILGSQNKPLEPVSQWHRQFQELEDQWRENNSNVRYQYLENENNNVEYETSLQILTDSEYIIDKFNTVYPTAYQVIQQMRNALLMSLAQVEKEYMSHFENKLAHFSKNNVNDRIVMLLIYKFILQNQHPQQYPLQQQTGVDLLLEQGVLVSLANYMKSEAFPQKHISQFIHLRSKQIVDLCQNFSDLISYQKLNDYSIEFERIDQEYTNYLRNLIAIKFQELSKQLLQRNENILTQIQELLLKIDQIDLNVAYSKKIVAKAFTLNKINWYIDKIAVLLEAFEDFIKSYLEQFDSAIQLHLGNQNLFFNQEMSIISVITSSILNQIIIEAKNQTRLGETAQGGDKIVTKQRFLKQIPREFHGMINKLIQIDNSWEFSFDRNLQQNQNASGASIDEAVLEETFLMTLLKIQSQSFLDLLERVQYNFLQEMKFNLNQTQNFKPEQKNIFQLNVKNDSLNEVIIQWCGKMYDMSKYLNNEIILFINKSTQQDQQEQRMRKYDSNLIFVSLFLSLSSNFYDNTLNKLQELLTVNQFKVFFANQMSHFTDEWNLRNDLINENIINLQKLELNPIIVEKDIIDNLIEDDQRLDSNFISIQRDHFNRIIKWKISLEKKFQKYSLRESQIVEAMGSFIKEIREGKKIKFVEVTIKLDHNKQSEYQILVNNQTLNANIIFKNFIDTLFFSSVCQNPLYLFYFALYILKNYDNEISLLNKIENNNFSLDFKEFNLNELSKFISSKLEEEQEPEVQLITQVKQQQQYNLAEEMHPNPLNQDSLPNQHFYQQNSQFYQQFNFQKQQFQTDNNQNNFGQNPVPYQVQNQYGYQSQQSLQFPQQYQEQQLQIKNNQNHLSQQQTQNHNYQQQLYENVPYNQQGQQQQQVQYRNQQTFSSQQISQNIPHNMPQQYYFEGQQQTGQYLYNYDQNQQQQRSQQYWQANQQQQQGGQQLDYNYNINQQQQQVQQQLQQQQQYQQLQNQQSVQQHNMHLIAAGDTRYGVGICMDGKSCNQNALQQSNIAYNQGHINSQQYQQQLGEKGKDNNLRIPDTNFNSQQTDSSQKQMDIQNKEGHPFFEEKKIDQRQKEGEFLEGRSKQQMEQLHYQPQLSVQQQNELVNQQNESISGQEIPQMQIDDNQTNQTNKIVVNSSSTQHPQQLNQPSKTSSSIQQFDTPTPNPNYSQIQKSEEVIRPQQPKPINSTHNNPQVTSQQNSQQGISFSTKSLIQSDLQLKEQLQENQFQKQDISVKTNDQISLNVEKEIIKQYQKQDNNLHFQNQTQELNIIKDYEMIDSFTNSHLSLTNSQITEQIIEKQEDEFTLIELKEKYLIQFESLISEQLQLNSDQFFEKLFGLTNLRIKLMENIDKLLTMEKFEREFTIIIFKNQKSNFKYVITQPAQKSFSIQLFHSNDHFTEEERSQLQWFQQKINNQKSEIKLILQWKEIQQPIQTILSHINQNLSLVAQEVFKLEFQEIPKSSKLLDLYISYKFMKFTIIQKEKSHNNLLKPQVLNYMEYRPIQNITKEQIRLLRQQTGGQNLNNYIFDITTLNDQNKPINYILFVFFEPEQSMIVQKHFDQWKSQLLIRSIDLPQEKILLDIKRHIFEFIIENFPLALKKYNRNLSFFEFIRNVLNEPLVILNEYIN